MHYITKEKLIEALQQLPSGTEIVTNVSDTAMEIELDRRDNNAD